MTVLATPSASDLAGESIRTLYDQLAARLKDISHLQGIARLLGWDQLVMMPEKAEDARSDHRRQMTEDLSSELNSYELANIRLAQKSYKGETLIPNELVEASSTATTKSVSAWEKVRETSDFSKFAPFLEEQIRLIRQTATYKMKGGICKEAIRINKKACASLILLDEYEPGFKDSRLEALFIDLKQHLIPLIAKIKAKNFQHENGFLKSYFDVEKQAELSHLMCKKMGFNTDARRLDPGFNRIESDEVTYPMYIILRYEIEKALIEGDIQVADVPAVWNAKMKEYLGLKVIEDRAGCLQDTHWAIGLIGYFPTYTLGSIYAAQIFGAAKEAIPDLDEHLANGDLSVLKEWLNKNIHEQGSLKESGDDLILALTGKPLDSSLLFGT
ncbi:hypothetical protein BGW39_007982 [Mortierella sp. 14UC]|nr:hypothetical protein BGW39_007982 [Mortierella sp. 14UC]